MADGIGDYISSSLDPFMGQTVAAANAAQLAADPSRLAWGSDPLGQAFGQLQGQIYQSRAQQLATALAQERQAAIPDLARFATAEDPTQVAAQNPGANPYALARWVGGLSPQTVSESRLRAAQAQQAAAEAQKTQWMVSGKMGSQIPAANAGYVSPGGQGGAPGPAAQLVNDPRLFPNNPSGTYGGGSSSGGGGLSAEQQAAEDRVTLAAVPRGPDAMKWLAAQPPAVQAKIRAAWARAKAGVPPPVAPMTSATRAA